MLNLIPAFVQRALLAGERRGSLTCGVIFADVSGFTAITEKLMRGGHRGAEELSELINRTFGPLIQRVHRAGGYIINFAGDAFTALLPGTEEVLPLAQDLSDFFNRRRGRGGAAGDVELTCRVGAARGEVDWGIIEVESRSVYYFRGEPIRLASAVTQGAPPGSIALDRSLFRDEDEPLILTRQEPGRGAERLRPNVVRRFFPEAVLRSGFTGEFRDVVPVFVAFRDVDDHDSLADFVDGTLREVQRYGGYLNGLFFDDKGPNLFVLFGAPTAYESTPERAASFALALRRRFAGRIRVGLSLGRAYAGIIGSPARCNYTAMGSVVNLAARLFAAAPWGQIWLDEAAARALESICRVVEDGRHAFKGLAEERAVYRLLERTRGGGGLYRGEFRGRAAELNSLVKAFTPLGEGRFCGVCYLYGEPGIGKSRLASEFATAIGPGVRTVTLQTDGILRRSLNPFVYALERYFEQSREATERENSRAFEKVFSGLLGELEPQQDPRADAVTAELRRLRGMLGALLGLREADALYEQLDAKGRFDNTLDALKTLFKALALIRPTLLVLEDLQWLDDDSRRAFAHLSHNVEDYALGILMTSRFNDDGSKPTLAGVGEESVSVVTLDSLSPEAARDIIESELGHEVTGELVDFILERSRANPFYLEQFCRFLRDSGHLEKTERGLSLAARPEGIPAGIRAVLIARLDRLSRELRELVQTAAVLGREFEIAVLSAMLRGRPIDALLGQGVDEAIWSTLSELACIFNHALLRDSAYEIQLLKRRRELHALAAGALRRLHGDSPSRFAELAHHYEHAEDWDNARLYLGLAADHAREEYRNEQALGYLERLIRLLEDPGEARRRNYERARLWTAIGEWANAVDFYREDLQRAEREGAIEEQAQALSELTSVLILQARHEEAFELTEQGLALDLSGPALQHRVSLIGTRGTILYYRCKYDEARESLREAVELALETDEKKSLYQLYSNLGNTHIEQGDFNKAAEFYEASIKICRELGFQQGIYSATHNLGIVETYLGNYTRSRELLEESLELSTRLGNKQSVSIALGSLGSVYYYLKDYRQSEIFIRKKLEISRELDDRRSMMYAFNSLCILTMDKESYEESLELCRKQRELAVEQESKKMIALADFRAGETYFHMGAFSEAESYLTKAIPVQREIGDQRDLYESLASLGRLYRASGRTPEALELQDEIEKACAVLDTAEYTVKASGNKALTLIELQRHDEARRAFGEARQALETIEDLHEKIDWLLKMADFELEAKDLTAAAELHQKALDHLRGIEAPGLLALKERLLAARLRAPTDPEGAVDACRAVCDELVAGETNNERAELRARTALELHRLTGGEVDRLRAVEACRELLRRLPLVRYKEELRRLERPDT